LAFAAFLAIGAVKSSITFEADLARAAPRTSITVIAASDWLDGAWRRLPQRRTDLFGATEEVAFLQAAVDPATISASLVANGWAEAPAFTAADFAFFLVPAAPLDAFAPLPLLDGGRLPAMTFTRPGSEPETRYVFRLWVSSFAIRHGDQVLPIMVGSMTEERVTHPYEALTILSDRPAPLALVDETRMAVARIGAPAALVIEQKGPSGPVILIGPR
jgi:undecaprenyl-diphosphatase